MAIVRRKSNGCRRGAFKKKPMGKGWAAHRVTRGTTKPVVRIRLEGESAKKAEASGESND